MPSSKVDAQIQANSPDLTYFPGGVIEGNVILKVPKTTSFRRISIDLKSEYEVNLLGSASNKPPIQSGPHECYSEMQMLIVGDSSSHTFDAGSHSLPFKFQIPVDGVYPSFATSPTKSIIITNALGAMDGSMAKNTVSRETSLSHFLEIVLDSGPDARQTIRKHIIIRPIPLSDIPRDTKPLVATAEGEVKKMFGSALLAKIEARMTYPRLFSVPIDANASQFAVELIGEGDFVKTPITLASFKFNIISHFKVKGVNDEGRTWADLSKVFSLQKKLQFTKSSGGKSTCDITEIILSHIVTTTFPVPQVSLPHLEVLHSLRLELALTVGKSRRLDLPIIARVQDLDLSGIMKIPGEKNPSLANYEEF